MFDFETVSQELHFYSSKDDEYLQKLRNAYSLDLLIQNASSDIERVQIMADWVSSLWEHDGWNASADGDAIKIIAEAKKGEKFRCVEYSIVLTSVLAAIGFPSRTLGLMTKDVETTEAGAGHVVSEVYLYDFEKWVMVDAQWNCVVYIDEKPASAVELALAIANKNKQIHVISKNKRYDLDYQEWISPYLYFFTTKTGNSYSKSSMKIDVVRLAPIGAKEPLVFQIKYPMQSAKFTHSYQSFYPDNSRIINDPI